MTSTAPVTKNFTNITEVFDKMLELGFFNGSERYKESQLHDILNPTAGGPFSSAEYWYSGGVIEVKIFRQYDGTYRLANFRHQQHKNMTALFEAAA